MNGLLIKRIYSIHAQYPILFYFTSSYWRQRKVLKILHGFTQKIILDRKEQLQNEILNINDSNEEGEGEKVRLSFLDMLLTTTDLSFEGIREEVDTFLFAGHDTTTAGMTFSIYNLAKYPEIQQRAFEEVRNIIGSDPIATLTYADLQEMKYLEMVIKETLRLYPPVALIGRQVAEEIEIDGIKVPPGIDITIPIFAIHRNPKVFRNPEKFDPERHTEEGQGTRGPFDYIPFSAGGRNCIGQRFAMLEMKSVLAGMLLNYRIIATDRTKSLTFCPDTVLRPENGLYVRLERRSIN